MECRLLASNGSGARARVIRRHVLTLLRLLASGTGQRLVTLARTCVSSQHLRLAVSQPSLTQRLAMRQRTMFLSAGSASGRRITVLLVGARRVARYLDQRRTAVTFGRWLLIALVRVARHRLLIRLFQRVCRACQLVLSPARVMRRRQWRGARQCLMVAL